MNDIPVISIWWFVIWIFEIGIEIWEIWQVLGVPGDSPRQGMYARRGTILFLGEGLDVSLTRRDSW